MQTERTFAKAVQNSIPHILLHLDFAIEFWKNSYARLKIQTSPLWTANSSSKFNI